MAERRPLATLADSELEEVLADLGRQLSYPPTPDLARSVRDRLAVEPVAGGRGPAWLLPLSPRRVVALAAAVLLLILAGTLAFSPAAREAVADRLGLRGVVIRFVGETPTPAPSPLPVGRSLLLGRQVTLAEARAEVPYEVLVPSAEGWQAPDSIYLSRRGVDRMVSFVYRPRPGLPESPITGIGALLTQFDGETDRTLIEKGVFAKGIRSDTTVEAVTVNGEPGFWINGEPHFFLYRDPTGEIREEEFRLAGNVLLWEQDGLTFRLEADLTRDEAIAIAESLRPVD